MKSVLITSSILILLIAVLRPSLRGRADPRIQYALWLIIALRLLVPVDAGHPRRGRGAELYASCAGP